MKQLTPIKSLKLRLIAHLFATAAAVAFADLAAAAEPADPDIALKPAHIIVNPWRFHIPPTKRQGVPGIERTAKGRLWAVYGRDVESTRNYQVLIRSQPPAGRFVAENANYTRILSKSRSTQREGYTGLGTFNEKLPVKLVFVWSRKV